MSIPALGDLAYYAFRPIVYAIDAVWGTDMRHCTVCKARRARWNRLPYSRTMAVLVLASGISAICWLVIK